MSVGRLHPILKTVFQLAMIALILVVLFLGFVFVGVPFAKTRNKMEARHLFREGKMTRQEAVEELGADDPVFQEIRD